MTTPGITIHCEAKRGTHDTLQFYFPTIAPEEADLSSVTFTFTGFNTPWSARDLNKIDIRTYPDKECLSPNV